jgi:general secretion pathway protein M
MIETLLRQWGALAIRERRMVLGALVVIAAALLYLLAFEPAWTQGRKLAQDLPVLRAQAAQIGALAAEARRLSAVPRTSESPQALQAALAESTRAAGFGAALAELKRDGTLFELRFAGVPHEPWLLWLDASLRQTRLRVVDLSITRAGAPGIVNVKLVLESPARAGR